MITHQQVQAGHQSRATAALHQLPGLRCSGHTELSQSITARPCPCLALTFTRARTTTWVQFGSHHAPAVTLSGLISARWAPPSSGVQEEDILYDVVKLKNSNKDLSFASASNMPVTQLAKENATVYIKAPDDDESPAGRRVKELEKDLATTNAKLDKFMQETAEQLEHLACSTRVHHKVAKRRLLDNVRERLLGRQLGDADRGEAWNRIIQQLPDDQLSGMTRNALQLTAYGRYTPQWQASQAAHEIDASVIAEAVVSDSEHSDTFRQLFQWYYNSNPEDAVFRA